MASLTGNTIASTYTGLLKTADNSAITTTSKNITDGAGNVTALNISSDSVTVSGSLILSGSLVVEAGLVLGVTASNATTASFATTASYLLGSITSASYASTASYVVTASTASYVAATNVDGTVTYATYAVSASYAPTTAPIIDISGSTIYTTDPDTAGFSTVSGIFLGDNAGTDATGADYSVFIGAFAGQNATTADNAVFIGASAGDGATDSNAGVFIGNTAGQYATNADHSVFIGLGAGASATTAQQAVFLGEAAGANALNAANSTLIGYQAGALGGGTTGVGSNNIIIGTNITLPDDAVDSINIGGIIFATGSYNDTGAANPFSGSVAGAKVGIGTNTPEYTLDISGSARLQASTIILTEVSASLNFADDTAAAAGGVPLGGLYRNGNVVSIRIA